MLEPMKRETANTDTPPRTRRWRRCAAGRRGDGGLDAGGCLGGFPVAAAEVAEVDATASRVREEDRVLRWWEPVKRLKRDRLERDRSRAEPRLGVLESAVRVCPPDVDNARDAINVALLERKQLRGSQS